MFLLSHLFSVITYEPLLNELCDFMLFVNDEKIGDLLNKSIDEVIFFGLVIFI